MQKGNLILISIISLLTSCFNNQSQTQSTAQTKINDASNKKNENTQQLAFAAEPVAENVAYEENSSEKKPEVNKKAAMAPVQISLKDKYKNYFPIGTAVDVKNDLSNPQTVSLITTQFASLSPKTALQPLRVHPREATYDWSEGDALVDFAQKNNLLVRGHCLIYDKHMPGWFYKDGDKPASKDLILQRIKTMLLQ